MGAMFIKAESLTEMQKRAFEEILGRQINSSETVSILAHQTVAKDANRFAALERYFAEARKREPIDEAELDDAITEAMRSVRPGYTPIK